jgi:hypothetical protein
VTVKLNPEAAAYLEREWCAGTNVKIMTAEINRMCGANLTTKQVGWNARQRGLERPADNPYRKNRKLTEAQALALSFERAAAPRRIPPDRMASVVTKFPTRGFTMLGGTIR